MTFKSNSCLCVSSASVKQGSFAGKNLEKNCFQSAGNFNRTKSKLIEVLLTSFGSFRKNDGVHFCKDIVMI